MRMIHTSDLHVGKRLYDQDRTGEFEAFFSWLSGLVVERGVDLLLVSGDVFDVGRPSNEAAKMYYDFLKSLVGTCCRNVVVTSGNHDSPDFLAAPKEILSCANVTVVPRFSGNVDDEIVEIRGGGGDVEAIVCAVPYLRETDVSIVRAGDSAFDCERIYSDSIASHYSSVSKRALEARGARGIPVIGMGHLFSCASLSAERCGETSRDITLLGTAVSVEPSLLSGLFDYLALGHVHKPMRIAPENEMCRYSGSPIRLSFSESPRKSVCLVDFDGASPSLERVPVPVFHGMTSVSGDSPEAILSGLSELRDSGRDDYVEVVFSGDRLEYGSLSASIDEIASSSAFTVLQRRFAPPQGASAAGFDFGGDDSLSFSMLASHDEVLGLCLSGVPDEDRRPLEDAYREAERTLEEES